MSAAKQKEAQTKGSNKSTTQVTQGHTLIRNSKSEKCYASAVGRCLVPFEVWSFPQLPAARG